AEHTTATGTPGRPGTGSPPGEPTPEEPSPEEAAGEDAAARQVPLLVQQLGGWRGLFDSTFPVIVFVVANTLGGLTVAIWAAVGAALLVSALRLARKQSVQQAVSGLFGVAVAAFIAHRTGSAKGYFLFGI